MEIHFRLKRKKPKWPNRPSPFSAPKTKTNFGRLLVWWLDVSDPDPLRFYDRSTPCHQWQDTDDFGEATQGSTTYRLFGGHVSVMLVLGFHSIKDEQLDAITSLILHVDNVWSALSRQWPAINAFAAPLGLSYHGLRQNSKTWVQVTRRRQSS